MRLLFVKRRLAYPRSSGHDVHTWELMRALGRQGHRVSFASLESVDPAAVHGLDLAETRELPSTSTATAPHPQLTALQERFRNYWGIGQGAIENVGRFADDVRADAVVLSGLEILPCLGGISRAVRVWYAGDEWTRHHLSLIRVADAGTWNHLKPVVVKGLYEWAFASAMDRVWVVSEDERRAAQRIMWGPAVDVVPNGVDIEYFSPSGQAEAPASACFWGRLDFEPNIDAVRWFCRAVWPRVRAEEPRAAFTVYGFQPTPEIRSLCAMTPGVRLVADLPDLRAEIGTHELVVLPFVSGGGIKNKLLEAAALARPVVASPRACEGLHGTAPIVQPVRPDEWVAAILDLWRDEGRRRAYGASLRGWVTATHSWKEAARLAAAGIEASIRKSGRA